ncbi:MAG TPA: response regulator [Pirellulales bacterium]|nr:response regulator [Pirellulales bacterium]
MLVLSRRVNQKIVFPTLQTTIQVLEVHGHTARLGITAPRDVPVAREEILSEVSTRQTPCGDPAAAQAAEQPLRELRHLARNQLHTWSLGLALLRGQWDTGAWDDLETTLEQLESELNASRDRFETMAPKASGKGRLARKALLVEDNRNERELLAGFLRMSGFDVATAGDGADALDYLAAEGRPDVVLMDMIMPRCDGPTTVRRIRSNPRWDGLKIFAVSGQQPNEVPLECGPAGVDGWFAKPVDPRTLVRELSRELAAEHDGRQAPKPA